MAQSLGLESIGACLLAEDKDRILLNEKAIRAFQIKKEAVQEEAARLKLLQQEALQRNLAAHAARQLEIQSQRIVDAALEYDVSHFDTQKNIPIYLLGQRCCKQIHRNGIGTTVL